MAALWTAKAWSRATVEASIRASASNDPTHAVWRVRTFARLTSRASSSEYAAGATASRASVEMKAWRYEPMMRVSSPMPLRSLVISSYAAIVSGVTGTADWRRMSRASTRSRTWETRFPRASTAPRNSGESTAGKYSETSQRGSEETMEVSLDIGPPVRHSIGRPRRLNRHYTAVPANFRLGFRHSRVPLIERTPDTCGETVTRLSQSGVGREGDVPSGDGSHVADCPAGTPSLLASTKTGEQLRPKPCALLTLPERLTGSVGVPRRLRPPGEVWCSGRWSESSEFMKGQAFGVSVPLLTGVGTGVPGGPPRRPPSP